MRGAPPGPQDDPRLTQHVGRCGQMSEAQPGRADLLAEMADAQDSIGQRTRDLLWWNSIVLLAGLLLPSIALLVCGILVLGGVWALRRHQVVSAGVSLVVGVFALALSGTWRIIQQPSPKAWIHIVVLLLIGWQLVHATAAAIRYRHLSTTYREHFAGDE